MSYTVYTAEEYDVIVVGAGHAGIEAALAAARTGQKTALFTLMLDLVGNMPCNPSIGGTGKGHLVFEIDALGGEMGRAADAVMLQSRMLNTSKGPAVHSLRMQADRRKYQEYMKHVLENTANLTLIQAEVVGISVQNKKVDGVYTAFGGFYPAKAVIIATGTSLRGRIICGEEAYDAGPDNTVSATRLSKSLEEAGIKLVRFKTGTPPRIHADSIDYSQLEVQYGDEPPTMFTSDTPKPNKKVCYIAYTNEETHRIIRENLHRSPLYSGVITGTGPRYCPSIEDKVVRFADKPRHQLFIEPMGENTKEMYIQGLSSSLPEEVQKQVVHSIKGLERAVFMRTAYAIEYDCCDPTQLYPTLEFKEISGLYGAGQFNGTSGYEEAAAQGLIAGINASLKIQGKEPLVLLRSESYIGTLIDDLVTKGTNEPYRIMTSRSEYRLLLRQDNAKTRLIEKGRRVGLVSDEKYAEYRKNQALLEAEIQRLRSETLRCTPELNQLLTSYGYEELHDGIRKAELLKRPLITIDDIYRLEGRVPDIPNSIKKRAEIEIKYEGYIKKQLAEVERFKKLEEKKIPPDIDYKKIKGIRLEAMQKLEKIRPENIGQASRISGISPADISVLLIYLSQYGRGNE
ncbi:MAG TPA: tRNA uridine-5-carboxymethylaminomethyl(34) synthesis enzyme MnmG [Bacillota bacterium]|nr:tRNA uridine-5-carboxymethylaminomethyl(34) synthesis enzyme MnmG [Bacillota bacterium]HOK68440.1 tRNA uridine-5-carboxymethylaminomethyl(34) synthesis enzyme MnmG [Bacillota bacterium]HPP85074.1 tRNA uridine-5-carboxymethylaminomethyl(34) synthesis enzyme MnmG [Bacillota bacterium]